MAMRLITLMLLLPVTLTADMEAETEDPGIIDIKIGKSPDGISVFLDWDYLCEEEDVQVKFTVVYKKIGALDSESQECVVTDVCSCEIPSDLLDHGHNYTLLVSSVTPEGKTLSDSKNFNPNQTKPPPDVNVLSSDALVIVNMSTSGPVTREEYNVTLRKSDSTEEISAAVRRRSYIIPPDELLPEQTYCVKVNVYDILEMELSPFSPEKCFTAPAQAPPNNLRMEALDLKYLLKWDWDFDRSPNATFLVEKCYSGDCFKMKGCENITTTQCNCSLIFNGKYILRASVYDSEREERSSSVIQFNPSEDTIISPPKDVKMRIVHGELFINVTVPEVLKHTDINSCNWKTHLKYWINSTHNSEVMFKQNEAPFFKIESLETSTTYCVKTKMKCVSSDLSSLYSEVYCITTDPRSHLVAWITGFTFCGIVVISVLLYICFCPLKRYIKHIFCPSSNLPSSIKKDFAESPLDGMKKPFLSHVEETMDRFYIVQNPGTENLVQLNCKNTSQANSQDAVIYANESQTAGENVTNTQ